jgi:hypothetical protein
MGLTSQKPSLSGQVTCSWKEKTEKKVRGFPQEFVRAMIKTRDSLEAQVRLIERNGLSPGAGGTQEGTWSLTG